MATNSFKSSASDGKYPEWVEKKCIALNNLNFSMAEEILKAGPDVKHEKNPSKSGGNAIEPHSSLKEDPPDQISPKLPNALLKKLRRVGSIEILEEEEEEDREETPEILGPAATTSFSSTPMRKPEALKENTEDAESVSNVEEEEEDREETPNQPLVEDTSPAMPVAPPKPSVAKTEVALSPPHAEPAPAASEISSTSAATSPVMSLEQKSERETKRENFPSPPHAELSPPNPPAFPSPVIKSIEPNKKFEPPTAATTDSGHGEENEDEDMSFPVLPFGMTAAAWNAMPSTLRLQIWLSYSMASTDNPRVQYNELHMRHVLRSVMAGFDPKEKIPCPSCGHPGDVTLSPTCTVCGVELMTSFEPTGPVDKPVAAVADVTDLVAAAVRATAKGEFGSVIHDWTCAWKGRRNYPKSIKKCFCVLDFERKCLRFFMEPQPMEVDLAFDTAVRHSTTASHGSTVEMVVHYAQASVVECRFSCADADLAKEWCDRIHLCATSVSPMSNLRSAVRGVWGDGEGSPLNDWYLLVNPENSYAPVELLKFPNNKRQMQMECSFQASKVARPVQLGPRSIVRKLDLVVTEDCEVFALVHCPTTCAVGLTPRNNLFKLGLDQSAEWVRQLLERAASEPRLSMDPCMPLLQGRVSLCRLNSPSSSSKWLTDVPTPKLMELCTVVPATGNEWQHRSDEAVRFVFISDTHGRHDHLQLPEGDILVHGGDFIEAYPTNTALQTNNKLPPPLEQLRGFLSWLRDQSTNYKHVVLIAGNHDTLVDPMVLSSGPNASSPLRRKKSSFHIHNASSSSLSPFTSSFSSISPTSPYSPSPYSPSPYSPPGEKADQWTVTPQMHLQAMQMMRPMRLGGLLPNNCTYLDGVKRKHAVLTTKVKGKVLRFFGSPICRSRDPSYKAKRNSMGFCWLHRLEEKREITGPSFVVSGPDHRAAAFKDAGVHVLREPPSAQSSEESLALVPVEVGTRLTVLRWKHNRFNQLLYAHVECVPGQFGTEDGSTVVTGWIDGAYLQCVRRGNIMAVDLADKPKNRIELMARPEAGAGGNVVRHPLGGSVVEVRGSEHVCILETRCLSHGYYAFVRRESDWTHKGWVLCHRLRETTLYSRQRLWDSVKDGEVDVLLTHTPPCGICSEPANSCRYLADRLGRMVYPPRYHLFGHEHRLQNSFNAGDGLENSMKGLNLTSVCDVEATIPGESKCSRIVETVLKGLRVPQRRRRPITFINGSQMTDLPTVSTQKKESKMGKPVIFEYDLGDHHVYKRPMETMLLCLQKKASRRKREACKRCDSAYYCAHHPVHICETRYAQTIQDASRSSRSKTTHLRRPSRGDHVYCGWVTKRPTKKKTGWSISAGKERDRFLAIVHEGSRFMLRYFSQQGAKLKDFQLDKSCHLQIKTIQNKEYFEVHQSNSGNRFMARVCSSRSIPPVLKNLPISKGGLGENRVPVYSNEQWILLLEQMCRPGSSSIANQVSVTSLPEAVRTTVASLINEYLPKSCRRFMDLSEERTPSVLSPAQRKQVRGLRQLLAIEETSPPVHEKSEATLKRHANYLAVSTQIAASAAKGSVSQSEFQAMRKTNMDSLIADISSSDACFIYKAGLVAATDTYLDKSITKKEFTEIYLKEKNRLRDSASRGDISYEDVLAIEAKLEVMLRDALNITSMSEFLKVRRGGLVDVMGALRTGLRKWSKPTDTANTAT